MLKNDFVTRYPDVAEGAWVKCQDGEKLGKVSALDDDSFVVHKGIFFPKDFILRYDDIQDFRDGALIVNKCHTDLSEWRDTSYSGWSDVDQINEGALQAEPRPEFKDRYRDWGKEDVRVPVMEEQLHAEKKQHQAGEVRLRKVVHTEMKHFTVPVAKEEVKVERLPASEARSAESLASGEDAFKEETISIPVMEEEVTASKHPVMKEEVRLHKVRTEEQRDISDEVRKEDVEIDEDVPDKRRKLG
jgi:uncharacterized protein (TIGR02271 family)